MAIEKQNRPILAPQRKDFLTYFQRVAIARLAVRQMQDSWRKRTLVLGDPALQSQFDLRQRLAHRCSAVGNRLRPDRQPDRHFDPST